METTNPTTTVLTAVRQLNAIARRNRPRGDWYVTIDLQTLEIDPVLLTNDDAHSRHNLTGTPIRITPENAQRWTVAAIAAEIADADDEFPTIDPIRRIYVERIS
jgi:hypothetical protein